jgi:hypothetical protein
MPDAQRRELARVDPATDRLRVEHHDRGDLGHGSSVTSADITTPATIGRPATIMPVSGTREVDI